MHMYIFTFSIGVNITSFVRETPLFPLVPLYRFLYEMSRFFVIFKNLNPRKKFLWKIADVDAIRQDLQEYADAFAADNTPSTPIGQLWADFKETVLSIVEKRVPSKATAPRHSNSWTSTSTRKAIRRKQRAHKKARKTGKKRDIDRYKRLQAEVKYDIKQAGKVTSKI